MPYSNLQNLIPDYIKKFEAYTPSKPDDTLCKTFHCPHLYRLNNNENPLGPPQASQKIIKEFLPFKASVYPSGDSYHLRSKLGDKFNLHHDQFLVGNGANELISFVIKAFCEKGDNIVTADKTFAVYEWVAEFSGFQSKLVPLLNYGFDPEGILNAIDNKTKIIFICNPNNPTGTYWDTTTLTNFLDRVNGRQIVVLDEAYFEFVDKEDYPNGMNLIERYPNLVVFRTFSKMYGLAGLRVGFLAGTIDVVDTIRKTCVVYSVNVLAQEAATAALDDDTHIYKTRNLIKTEKNFITEELSRLGVYHISGEGCYLMFKLPISDTLAYRKFITQGIIIRSMTGFRFPNWIRVSISTHQIMEKFIDTLEKILKKRV